MQFRDIRASEAAGIAIIHQELALIPELSITENIFLGNEMTGRFGRIDWVRREVPRHPSCSPASGSTDDPDTLIKNIGVGKQQLVEIAKALNKDVKLLILDEPTAALNETDSQHLLDLIRGLKGKGIASIMISHKLNEIEQIADAITIIRDGKTIETLDVAARRDRRGPHHPRHGRPQPREPLPRPHAARSARCSSRSRTGPSSTRRCRSAWSPRTRTSTCAAARSSASPASWAPAAPSSP